MQRDILDIGPGCQMRFWAQVLNLFDLRLTRRHLEWQIFRIPKNHGISKLVGLEIPEPCYTDSNPSLGGSNDS